jgi:hypothetical protein
MLSLSEKCRSSSRKAGLLIVLCSLIAAQNPVRAQQQTAVSPNSYTDISDYLVIGNQAVPRQTVTVPSAANLSSTVTQFGQANTATATLSGSANLTSQFQSGWQNTSTLAVNGTQNSITTAQIGNANTTSIGVQGNNNSISNLQVGSGLSYQLQVIGTSAPISVQQYGRR